MSQPFNPAMPLSQIKPWNSALRAVKKDEKFAELVESIKSQGVLQAILVRPVGDGTFVLVDGLHRFLASVEAGKDTIPTFIREMSEEQAYIAQITANIQRFETKGAEYSKGLRRMLQINTGWTVATLASSLGKSVGWVNDRLALADLNAEVRTALDKEEISLGAAVAIAQLAEDIQPSMLDDAKNQTLSVFQTTVKSRLRELRDKTPKKAGPAEFKPQAHLRKFDDLIAAVETGDLAKRIAATVDTPVDAAQATLKWVLNLDPEALEVQRAKWDAAQALKEEKKRKAAQETAAATIAV